MKELLEDEDKTLPLPPLPRRRKSRPKRRAKSGAETLPTDKTGDKRRNTARSRRIRRGQSQRLFLRRRRLRMSQW
jgi:hypothetical protein